MPTFRTKVAATDGMVFAGVRTNYLFVFNRKVDTAAATAVVTNGHDIIHAESPTPKNIKIVCRTFLLSRVWENEVKSQEYQIGKNKKLES